MIDLKRTKWIWPVCLGAGIAVILVLRNTEPSVSAQPVIPLAANEVHKPVLTKVIGPPPLPVGRPQDVAATPATPPVQPDTASAAMVGVTSAEVAETVLDDDRIYTMATLPLGKCGVYQVLVDGEVVKIAVDGAHD